VRDGEVVLAIQTLFGQRINVIDVQITFLQDEIDGPLTDETLARLPVVEPLFQACPRIFLKLLQEV